MRERLRNPVAAALGAAGELVDAQAGRLRGIRDQLAEEDLAVLGDVVDAVAGGVEGLGSRIDAIDSDHIPDVAHDVARRRGPLVFAAGGALVGVVVWATLR